MVQCMNWPLDQTARLSVTSIVEQVTLSRVAMTHNRLLSGWAPARSQTLITQVNKCKSTGTYWRAAWVIARKVVTSYVTRFQRIEANQQEEQPAISNVDSDGNCYSCFQTGDFDDVIFTSAKLSVTWLDKRLRQAAHHTPPDRRMMYIGNPDYVILGLSPRGTRHLLTRFRSTLWDNKTSPFYFWITQSKFSRF